MNTIKLNNVEFAVESYNKNTTFSGETVSSNGYISFAPIDNIDALNTLSQSAITSIQILHDEKVIYDLQNINAHVDSMNEYLSGDRMTIGVNLTFNI